MECLLLGYPQSQDNSPSIQTQGTQGSGSPPAMWVGRGLGGYSTHLQWGC